MWLISSLNTRSALANRQMAPDIELCCLVTSSSYAFLSATILKEVASLDGEYETWTPVLVREALQRKYANNSRTCQRYVRG